MLKFFIRRIKRITRGRSRRPVKKTKLSHARYQEHKESARELVLRRLEHFNRHYEFEYRRVAIKNTRTRWGSCSEKKNINFNYKISKIAPELADYVIVHELCHLKQMNHSRAFWKLVEEVIPNYKERRSELRKINMWVL